MRQGNGGVYPRLPPAGLDPVLFSDYEQLARAR